MNKICPQCGAMTRPGASFCGICRQPLASSSPPTPGWGVPAAASLRTDDGRRFPVHTPVTRIGRDPANEVHLADGRVSSHHAEIRQEPTCYVLRDLGSMNGTFVNGQRIAGDCSLTDGDTILVGGTRFTFGQQAAPLAGVAQSYGTQAMDPVDIQNILSGAPQPQRPPSASLSWPAGGPLVQQSPQPGPLQSPSPLSPPAQTGGGFWASLTAPTAVGSILFEPTESREDPPTDVARVLVRLAVILTFLGVMAAFIAVVIVLGAVLLCLGAAALLFVLPFLFTPIRMLFETIMKWLGEEKQVTVVRFRIDDELGGRLVDVVLMRKLGQGGGLHQGDRVEIWGRVKGGTLYAHKIQVEKSGAIIQARKPWPLGIGILALVSVIGGLVYLAVALDLIHM